MNELASRPPVPAVEDPTAARRPSGARLAVLVAGAVLLPALVLLAAGWGAWRGSWAEAERELVRATEVNAEYAQRLVDGHARVAARIAESLAAHDDAAVRAVGTELRESIGRFIGDLPLVRGAVVLDAVGDVLVLTSEAESGWARAPVGTFAAMLRDAPPGRVLLGAAYRPPGLSEPLLPLGQRDPVRGRAVVLVLDGARIGTALGRNVGGPEDSAALLRADGQILARHPGFVDPPPPLAPDRPVMAALGAGQSAGTLSGVTPRDAAPVLIAFRRVESVPQLAVAVSRRREAIAAQWRAAMVPVLGLGVPAILGLLGLALVVRRQQRILETALAGLEQRVAERTASLQEGEDRLRVAIQAGRFGTWETDARSGMTTHSPRALEIFGLSPDQAVGPVSDWAARIHPADRDRVLASWERLLAGRTPSYREEYRFRGPDGGWRWLESTAAVVRADPLTGLPIRFAGTIQDFTERHEAEARRELLTQEVNHRARNTLAIVQAILRLTRASSPTEFARLVEGRVAALARAQALLAAERWTGAPLKALLTDEMAPYGGGDEVYRPGENRFVLDGPPLRVRAEAVQALGMVFHELATNAAKHGALSVPEGRVSVTWSVDAAAELLRIRWAETGGPVPSLPKHRGVGSRVIEATINGQLGGAVERRWPEQGLVCEIALPLAKTRAAG